MAVRYSPKFCSMLEDHLAKNLSIEDFAKKIGCPKPTLYRWFDKYVDFELAKKAGERAALLERNKASIKDFQKRLEYRPEYCQKLIDHMEQGLSMESFAGSIGVSRSVLYKWVKEHEAFKMAKEIGQSKMLLMMEKIGMNGALGKIKNYNNSTWCFKMKNKCGWSDNPNATEQERKTFTLNYKDE